eukprot:9495611-Pyramimonas_sp.AAC.1
MVRVPWAQQQGLPTEGQVHPAWGAIPDHRVAEDKTTVGEEDPPVRFAGTAPVRTSPKARRLHVEVP